MRRFYAWPLGGDGELVRLDAATSHHLLRVTGVGPGEEVELFDGQGQGRLARFQRAEEGAALVEILGPVVAEPEEEGPWLVLALLKHAAFDTALRMATELGAGRILPVLAERSVARGERVERWERLVLAAATQCGRRRVPPIAEAAPLSSVLAALPPDRARWICLPGAPPLGTGGLPSVLLVGPEGGWSPSEAALALGEGRCLPLGLGPHVLRADTAVVRALAAASL